MSPIVYAGGAAFREDLANFASAHTNRVGIARHYLHLGERQRQTYFADGKSVHLKKLFYALRPAAALRWLRLNLEEAIAPMHFPTLMQECDAPREVADIAADLIARKAVTRELGSALLPPVIENFIDAEFALARDTLPASPSLLSPDAKTAADRIFRRYVDRFDTLVASTLGPVGGTTHE
ncbi:MAG: hypothetical protein AVDCRST_MAG91-250 [uncultured Sphingomonadaceae bacterium]|uniref:Uncharacterized protein n=1 Tax=uncultured Sphingomonadaceae bacterium TaxID=169976 RepID=A0A6J4RZ52_9SPHN|nr:MAG: hypothetical protein AVDCRST_MAG91-250 [uncultured Sphingomonadaceae bacterium]